MENIAALGPRRLVVAVPLYRAPELIPDLFQALGGVADEITALGGIILILNDSPDDEGLRAALDIHYPTLSRRAPVELVDNPQNLGFVATANRALELAGHLGADIVLLNSDALPTPGAMSEMAKVAYSDPMIGFVSPRSDNATICNSPCPAGFRGLGRVEALKAHLAVQSYLPRVTYVPTAVGFCLYIKHLMLEEFGLLDPIYGRGYNEENDFILRANLRGYRAALANHAFVHHIGTVSFAQSSASASSLEDVNRAILLERYPHYDFAVRRYFSGRHYQAEHLLAGLVPDAQGRLRMLFDGRDLTPSHNGTMELARAVIAAFASQFGSEFTVHVACSEAVAAFHGLDRVPGLVVLDPDVSPEEPFTVAVKLAQPFRLGDLAALASLAPVSGYLFLDTIALDCQQLDREDYGAVWSWMAETSAFLGFISRFSADQFERRFPAGPDGVRFVALCSTDVNDYAPSKPSLERDHILLVGNHYPHKHIADTVAALRARTDQPLVVMGGGMTTPQPGVTEYISGELAQDVVDDLYDRASCVVFPSHYEGFGLPVMHALARSKPVIARDLAPLREIKARCTQALNLHLMPTTAAMASAAAVGVAWRSSGLLALPTQTWADAARDIRNGARAALERLTYDGLYARLLKLQAVSGVAANLPAPPPVKRPVTVASPAEVAAWTLAAAAEEEAAGEVLYVAGDADLDDGGLLAGIFDAADRLVPGQRLRFTAPQGFGDVRARRLLLAAGLTPTAVPSSTDGGVDHLARPFTDWRDLAGDDGDGDDTQFVHKLYLTILGRPGDPDGVRNHLADLADRRPRHEIIKVFCSSRERLELVSALHDLPTEG